jgi:hypothetical protein
MKVDENLVRAREAFAAFVEAVAGLERAMTSESNDEDVPSGLSGTLSD